MKADRPDAILISMPWAPLNKTPIQLGTLVAAARSAGFRADSRSYFLAAADYFATQSKSLALEDRITISDYTHIAGDYWRQGLGDWIFAVPPYRKPSPEADREYFAFLGKRGVSEEIIRKAVTMRSMVPAFLEQCLQDLLALNPRTLGFTTVFAQNVASLVLAQRVKQAAPDIQIIFGGNNCEGPMGESLLKAFHCIDIIVRGEGEIIFPEILADLRAGQAIRPRPGLCYREDDRTVVIDPSHAPTVKMDEVPTPVYDEYFTRLQESSLYPELSHQILTLFESSRGCWWGERQHCTFCGLNNLSMKFRSKSAAQVAQEVLHLSGTYRQTKFQAVDNILDLDYLDNLLPTLRDYRRSGLHLSFFYETKSSLRKRHLRLMRDAGIRRIQPGIESLSTPILRLMRKGVTAWQNIALLKWAQQYGITVTWAILYGFPREPLSEYERMADLCESLTHLQPPGIAKIVVERFSPYHMTPQEFGLTDIKAAEWYTYVYDLSEEALQDLAYDFDHRFVDGYDSRLARKLIEPGVTTWWEGYHAGRNSLTYRRGPGFLTINDRRSNLGSSDYQLDEAEALIYLGCDSGATPDGIVKLLERRGKTSFSRADVCQFLDDLAAARLLYKENERYVSLAIPDGEDDENGDDVPEVPPPWLAVPPPVTILRGSNRQQTDSQK
jgi:ribosomal peptide maturation radical SAM protein 1